MKDIQIPWKWEARKNKLKCIKSPKYIIVVTSRPKNLRQLPRWKVWISYWVKIVLTCICTISNNLLELILMEVLVNIINTIIDIIQGVKIGRIRVNTVSNCRNFAANKEKQGHTSINNAIENINLQKAIPDPILQWWVLQ